jgi:hypothetical protein
VPLCGQQPPLQLPPITPSPASAAFRHCGRAAAVLQALGSRRPGALMRQQAYLPNIADSEVLSEVCAAAHSCASLRAHWPVNNIRTSTHFALRFYSRTCRLGPGVLFIALYLRDGRDVPASLLSVLGVRDHTRCQAYLPNIADSEVLSEISQSH